MAKLTKRIVDAAECRSSPYFIWCSDLPGFGVRTYPSGKRVYYADYRTRDGARHRLALGPHSKITTEEARRLAMVTLGAVLKGEDPAAERRALRKSLTVRELCADYLDKADRGLIMGKHGRPKKASTLSVDRGRIVRHIVPLLGTKRVRELTRADVNRFIRDVASGATAVVEKTEKRRGKAIVEGGPGTAARTAGLLGGILTFAVSEGIIEANPAHGVKRPADNRRVRRLSPEEYRALGQALTSMGAAGSEQGPTAIWLLALTGCRLGEIGKLRWDEIDEAGGCLRLLDSKEGASVRPVGQPVFQVLAAISKRNGCPYVLPGARSNAPFGGIPGTWKRISERAAFTDVTPHTLRHSFASVAGDLGFTESTIAALLGHAAGSVTSRYIHHLDSVLLAAADKVATVIRGHMTSVMAASA